MIKSTVTMKPTVMMASRGVLQMLSAQLLLFSHVRRRSTLLIKSSIILKPTPKNGVEESAAHAQASSVLMAISRWAKIDSNGKVNRNYETNCNFGVEKSSEHAQF